MLLTVLLTENTRTKIFDNIWVQPAAGDAGGSLGSDSFGIMK